MIRSIQTLTRRVGGSTPHGNPTRAPSRLTQLVTTGARGVIALLLLGSAVGLQAREMVSVAKPEINMRAGPGTGHPTLWTLARGYPLEVMQTQGQWFKVRDFEKDVGWVYRPLVSTVPYVVVTSRTANVRQAPVPPTSLKAPQTVNTVISQGMSRSTCAVAMTLARNYRI